VNTVLTVIGEDGADVCGSVCLCLCLCLCLYLCLGVSCDFTSLAPHLPLSLLPSLSFSLFPFLSSLFPTCPFAAYYLMAVFGLNFLHSGYGRLKVASATKEVSQDSVHSPSLPLTPLSLSLLISAVFPEPEATQAARPPARHK
jgi:hypothetical protein